MLIQPLIKAFLGNTVLATDHHPTEFLFLEQLINTLSAYTQNLLSISAISLSLLVYSVSKYKKHGESLGKETKNYKNVVYPSMYMFRIFLRIVLSL